MTPPRIPFLALRPVADRDAIRAAIDRVIDRGWFILGPEVGAFEREFAAASGAAHAIGVGTGTDALALALRASGVRPGDEVITAPVSAAFTALAIVMAGARPVFADIAPDRLTLDPSAVAAAVTSRTSAVLPVHLYGQPADMPAIMDVARRHNLAVVEDACQAHLATSGGRPVGTFGAAGAFSFYPTKNLGALGDGGAVLTNDGMLADRVRRLRHGGQTAMYHHDEAGVNSRLDELQAAVLRTRLPALAAETRRRREIAARYRRALAGAPVAVPPECDAGHVYHLFPIRAPDRDALRRHLDRQGVQTLVHYPVALSRQPAFAPFAPADSPNANALCREVCSLPLHPRLTDDEVDAVAAAVHAWRPILATPTQ
jgi:dTDP-3-amino-3,4,6-trideoxy-alpha-D-glucose transaminase